jgi:D-serine deaminase-like pyridoxal phosphate-dependent protein
VFAAAGRRLDVRLKIDSGLHRVGVLPEQALGVARAIAELPGLSLTGVFTHAGHAYGETEPEAWRPVAQHEGGTVAAVADALRRGAWRSGRSRSGSDADRARRP